MMIVVRLGMCFVFIIFSACNINFKLAIRKVPVDLPPLDKKVIKVIG